MEACVSSGATIRQRIVVGLDGSDGGRAALSWALAEARLRGAQLDVVSAWEYPFEWAEGFNPQWLQDEEFFRASALERAQADVDELLDGEPQPSWLRIVVVKGSPSDVLVAEAGGADLLVVGSRGRGGFAGLLLGSVSSACVHHSAVPVTVIRAPVGWPGAEGVHDLREPAEAVGD